MLLTLITKDPPEHKIQALYTAHDGSDSDNQKRRKLGVFDRKLRQFNPCFIDIFDKYHRRLSTDVRKMCSPLYSIGPVYSIGLTIVKLYHNQKGPH